jgi:hypothetical protein
MCLKTLVILLALELLSIVQAQRSACGHERTESFMSSAANRRYTTYFTSIAAGDVNVPGLAPGSAGSRDLSGNDVLTSRPGVFTIGPDTLRAMVRVPVRSMFVPELLAAD